MSDFDDLMHSLIAGLIGCVAGVLFASLLLSAYSASRAGMRWGDLSNVATFWAGHLTALSILIIGAGLLIQARQLRTQIQAERDLSRRSSLEWLTSHLSTLASELCAYYFDESKTPPGFSEHRGLQRFSVAVLSRPNHSEDIEVWVDNAALLSYLQAANAVKRVETELESPASTSGNSPCCFVYHRGICEFAERMLEDRVQFLKSLQQTCNNETALEGITEMLDQGWKIEENLIQGIHYFGARRLDPIFKRVEGLSASDESLQSACESLVQNWTDQYRSAG
jgi:hypothetical protein